VCLVHHVCCFGFTVLETRLPIFGPATRSTHCCRFFGTVEAFFAFWLGEKWGKRKKYLGKKGEKWFERAEKPAGIFVSRLHAVGQVKKSLP